MITYNIDVLIGKDNTDHKPVIKCHDTGVNFLVNLKTEHRASKWRTTVEPYTIPAGATAVIKVTKPDKHYVVQDGICQGSGVFFKPHPQTFTALGVASAEVNIFGKDGRRITSGTFFIDVTQECADDCIEDSQTYVSVMGEQIQAAINAADRAEEAAKRAEEAEESGGGEVSPEAIQQSVDKYMAEHPIKETDPTVPEWAKQPKKPTYTAAEVGAMPKDTSIPTVPDTLPNPKKLHITGAATATYDGSEEVTVHIPNAAPTPDMRGYVKTPDTAEVGQTIVVKAVDENGVPTEWEAADLASGGGTSNEWKLLIDAETTEEAHTIKYDFESPVSEIVGWVDLPVLNDNQGIVYAFIGLSDGSSVRLTVLNTNVTTRQRIYMQLNPAGGCVASKSGSYASGNTLYIMPDEYAVAIHDKFKNGYRFTHIRLSRSRDDYVFPVGAKFMLWGR